MGMPNLNTVFVVLLLLFAALTWAQNETSTPAEEEAQGGFAGDDFSNNLFSDIAPLLALFGERFTVSFMSESQGWLDHIVFAMVPLGIITAVVGALRIGGPAWLRAIIGRARENRASAEVELMSSTSAEVCELWNGMAIVRTLGKPEIKEIVYLEKLDDGESTFGLYSTPVADKEGILKCEAVDDPLVMWCKALLSGVLAVICGVRDLFLFPAHSLRHTKPVRDVENGGVFPPNSGAIPSAGVSKEPTVDTQPIAKSNVVKNRQQPGEESAPNISLNVHAHGGSKVLDLVFVAVVGIVMQFGFLVFVGAGVYHPTWKNNFLKEGQPVASYAYPLLAIGTIFIVLGMMICSAIVERSTEEKRWVAGSKYLDDVPPTLGRRSTWASIKGRTPGSNSARAPELGARVLWLQKNHTVGDQLFDSFVMFAQGKRESVLMSHRRGMEGSETDVNARRSRSKKGRRALWKTLASSFEEGFTLLGTFLSLAGFVLQFTGLRALNWTASIAQLVAIAIMTSLRAWLRRGMITPPVTARVRSAGHEMDWLALEIASEPNFWNKYSDRDDAYLEDADSSDPGDALETEPSEIMAKRFSICTGTSNFASRGLWSHGPTLPTSAGQHAMRVRQRLGSLTKWVGLASKPAVAVAEAIESVMNEFFDQPSEMGEPPRLIWSLKVKTSFTEEDEWINFTVKYDGHDQKWIADATEIEAALSLWIYDIQEIERLKAEDEGIEKTGDWLREGNTAVRRKSTRVLGIKDGPLETDLRWWLQDTIHPRGTYAEADLEVPPSTLDPLEYYQVPEDDGRICVGFTGLHQNGRTDQSDSSQTLAVTSEAPLEKLLAQHLFSGFMWAIADSVPDSKLRDLQTTVDVVNLSEEDPMSSASFRNDDLSRLLDSIDNHTLGTVLDLLMCIVPPLSHARKLPDEALVSFVRKKTYHLEVLGQWDKVIPLYVSLLDICVRFGEDSTICQKATLAAVEVYRNISSTCRLWERQYREGMAVDGLRNQRDTLQQRLKVVDGTLMFAFARFFSSKQGPPAKFDELKPQHWKIDKTKIDPREIHEFFGYSPFFKDLRSVSVGHVEEFVKQIRPNLDQRDIYGRSFLHYAVIQGTEQMVRGVISAGLTPQVEDIAGFTPLHYAALEGSGTSTSILLEYVADVDHRARDGTSPLHLAANEKVATQLIQRGANVELQDNMRRVPLHYAAFMGREKVVKLLIENRAFLNVRDDYGRTALHLAMISGNEGTMMALLRSVSVTEALDIVDRDGRNFLHLVAIQGLGKKALWLGEQLKSGLGSPKQPGLLSAQSVQPKTSPDHPSSSPDNSEQLKSAISTRDRDGRTPLHLAVLKGHKELVKMFLEWGADPNAKDSSQGTAIHFAAHYDRHEMIGLLVDKGGKIEERYKGTALGKDHHVKERATINDSSREATATQMLSDHTYGEEEEGSTPLLIAAARGNTGTMRALLKHHANLSASDDKWSALAFACSFGHVEAVKFLLEQGIEVDSRDLMRDTPLHNAASGGHDSVIRLLLEKGAEIQAGNNGLETPLHMACLHAKEVSTVRILLEHGADPNAHSLGTQCTTPLHIAAQNDSTEIVRLLLEKGADPNAKTEMIGWDALRLAQSVEVCEILIVAGADVKAISNSGFTQLAQSAGNLGKTKLLADHGVDFTRTGGPGNKGPISWAVAANDFYMARLAIEAGDDINRKDTETGGTPLHAAVQRKLFGMIKFLIKNGADKNVKNDNGETPWDLIRTAVFLGKHGWSDDIIRLLR